MNQTQYLEYVSAKAKRLYLVTEGYLAALKRQDLCEEDNRKHVISALVSQRCREFSLALQDMKD